MSSSSSDHVDDFEVVLGVCHCNVVAKLRESGQPGSPCRRFVNCARSLISSDACRFFRWVDPPLNKHYRDSLNRFKALSDGSEAQKLEPKLKEAELKLKKAEVKLGILESAIADQKEIMEKEKVVDAQKISELQAEVAWVWKLFKVVFMVAAGLFVAMVLGFK